MRQNENYSTYIIVSLILTLAILFSFQVYIAREPGRIEADEARDHLIAVTAGRSLFSENCALCHGEDGGGVDGPALNDKSFLLNTPDNRMFSVISSGIPSSVMPAWNQVFGGPFTNQQVNELVAFIRQWDQTALDTPALEMVGDPIHGSVIYNSKCIACHGENGAGTDIAPALNDLVRLVQFDDDWYVDTISRGRLTKGMPTWGTILSPAEIRDVVALLRAWERGETVEQPAMLVEALADALHLLEHGDMHTVEHALQVTAVGASGEVLLLINEAIIAAEAGDQVSTVEIINRIFDLLGENSDGHEAGDEHDDSDH